MAIARSDGVTRSIAHGATPERGSPGAALALLQSERWAQREALCQALMDSLHTGDWYAVLTALNHEQAPARLHWLATLLVDALKRQHGASYLTNVDADAVVAALAGRYPRRVFRQS